MSLPTPAPETIYSGPPVAPGSARVIEVSPEDVAQVEADLRRFMLHTVVGLIGALLLSAFFADFADRTHEDLTSLAVLPQIIWASVGALFFGAGLISHKIERFTSSVAIATLIAYAAAQGFVFGFVYRTVYAQSLGPVYLGIAVSFGMLWMYGTCTGCDVTSLKALLIGGGAAVCSSVLAKLWFSLSLQTAIAMFLGSGLMLCLLSYNRDFIRDLPDSFEDDWHWNKAAAIGALLIYLDLVIILVVVIQARWLASIKDKEDRRSL